MIDIFFNKSKIKDDVKIRINMYLKMYLSEHFGRKILIYIIIVIHNISDIINTSFGASLNIILNKNIFFCVK